MHNQKNKTQEAAKQTAAKQTIAIQNRKTKTTNIKQTHETYKTHNKHANVATYCILLRRVDYTISTAPTHTPTNPSGYREKKIINIYRD